MSVFMQDLPEPLAGILKSEKLTALDAALDAAVEGVQFAASDLVMAATVLEDNPDELVAHRGFFAAAQRMNDAQQETARRSSTLLSECVALIDVALTGASVRSEPSNGPLLTLAS